MPDTRVASARERRIDLLLDEMLDRELSVMFAATVAKDPSAAAKGLGPLRHLLKYYAKFPHPFTKCVRDNRKRFGPGRVERICARLVDILKGTTKWRNGGNHRASLADDLSVTFFADEEAPPPPPITDEVVALLDSLGDKGEAKLEAIYEEAAKVVSLHG